MQSLNTRCLTNAKTEIVARSEAAPPATRKARPTLGAIICSIKRETNSKLIYYCGKQVWTDVCVKIGATLSLLITSTRFWHWIQSISLTNRQTSGFQANMPSIAISMEILQLRMQRVLPKPPHNLA